MAKFNTDTLSLFHTFSKTQVNSDANKPQFSSLGNTVNKSGHTVQSNEIWTEAIPFFGLGVPADFSSTAQVNDLVKDADGVIWQRNATPYTDSNGTYWTQKTKSITSFTKGADGKYTFTEVDGALVDGSYLLNAAGVPTVKYHAKKQLTPLVSGNNAFIDSEKDASRLKIDGKWVDQFIGVTDVYVNGSAAVSYAPVLFSTSTATSPLKAGSGEDYLDYCATGIILWDKNDCTGNEVISCFEYVGTKLDATVAKLSAAVFGSGSSGGEDLSISEQVTANTAAINVLKSDATVEGSIAHSIKTATLTSGNNAIESATGDTATKLVTAEQVKEYVDENAKVTLTADTATGKTGIVIDNNGQEATSFTIGIDQEVIATKKSVDDLSSLVSGLPATIQAAQDAADDAMEEAQDKVASITTGTVPSGVSLGTDTKNPVLTIETETNSTNFEYSNKLITAKNAHYLATSYADLAEGAAVDTVKGISLGSSETSIQGSYVSVTTSGTIGTGLTVNVNDSALASTVSAAESAVQGITLNGAAAGVSKGDNNVIDITLPELRVSSAKDTTSNPFGFKVIEYNDGTTFSEHYITIAAAEYTPASGETAGSWAQGTTNYFTTASTVSSVVADAVAEAKAYSDSLHTTSLDYVVDDTLPVSVPTAEHAGKIYLVKTGKDQATAFDGEYLEYMAVGDTFDAEGKPLTYKWEQIGTSAANLSGYAKSVTINGTTYSASASNAGVLNLGTVVNSVSVGGSVSSYEEGNVASLMGHISDGSLYLGIASATQTLKGVSKLFYSDLSSTSSTSDAIDTAVSVKSAQAMYSSLATLTNSKISDVIADFYLSLAGFTVNTDDAGPQGRKIELELIYGNNGESYVVNQSNPNRVEGGILSDAYGVKRVIATDKIISGSNMFISTSVETWVDDLSNMTNGNHMFYECSALTSFCGDLSSLTDGSGMFGGCTKLTTCITDLSSLTDGVSMFNGCTLDAESLECIADTLPTVTSGTIDIGADTNATEEVIATIKGKGWTVKSNGTAL